MIQRDDDYKLMPLLFGLTFVSGLADALSFLTLGQVFVANMTGNVVLLGFAIGGAKRISIAGSFIAIAAFVIGGIVGGRLSRRHDESGPHLISVTTFVEVFLMLGAAAITWRFGSAGFIAYGITAVLAVSMGLQTAIARSLGVADITTTVITSTLAGFAMDLPLAGGANTRIRRRVTAIVIMFTGALVGAILIFKLGVPAALVAAALTYAIVSFWAWRLRTRQP
ncbi:MAG TPA: YoaK family protein [Verrucomicrobiae bacterium]|nr:YoaK family protein [Verrucomicrobiae bacterium]